VARGPEAKSLVLDHGPEAKSLVMDRGPEAKSLVVDRGRVAAIITTAMVITKRGSLSLESPSAFMMTTLTTRTITAATRSVEYILGMVGNGVGSTSAITDSDAKIRLERRPPRRRSPLPRSILGPDHIYFSASFGRNAQFGVEVAP
jgi:hypothetical protein